MQKKHKLIDMEDERERARTMQRLEVTKTSTTSPWSGGQERWSFGSCSSSSAPNTDEAMSASSRMALQVDKAISEESWTAFAIEKERDYWCSTDLAGEVEELEVGGPWTLPEGNSMDPDEEVYHPPEGEKAAVEEGER